MATATKTKTNVRSIPSPRKAAAEPPPEAPLYAEVEEVKEFAEGLPANFLECRELGHNWKPYTGSYVEGGIHRILRCPRCRTERHQEISLGGTIINSKYIHPDGYLHKGMGRIVGDGRDALRVESLTRFMTKVARDSQKQQKAS